MNPVSLGAMPRATDIRLAIAACVLAALHVLRALPRLDSVVDDAYISARYAMNLALGNGLTYNVNDAPVEGYTNLLWVFQTALGWKLAGSDMGAMHALLVYPGLFYGVVGIAASVWLTRVLVERPTWLALLPAFWLAIDPHYAVVATNGIESSQFIAFVLAASAATFSFRNSSGAARFVPGLLCGLLVAVRPEGIAVAGTLAAYETWRSWSDGRARIGSAAIGTALGVVPVWLGRAVYFGALVPNTWNAKDHRDLLGQLHYNITYLWPDRQFWLAALFLGLIALAPPFKSTRLAVLALALGLTAVAFQVDMWMPGGRLLLPGVTLALCAFASRLAELHHTTASPSVAVRRGLLVAFAASFAAPLLNGPVASRPIRYDGWHTLQPGNGTEIASRFIAEHAPPGSRIAMRDAGAMAFFVGPNLTVLETHERALTRRHPGGADTDPRTFVPADVEFVVVTYRYADGIEMHADNDAAVLDLLGRPYRFLGRVNQHWHRDYELYVRPDLAFPDLPPSIVIPREPPADFLGPPTN